MTKRKDPIPGTKFSMLSVVCPSDSVKGKSYSECTCDCGKSLIVQNASLKNGNTKSCGCIKKESTIKAHTTHGHAKKGRLSREYRCWVSMKERCFSVNHKNHNHYKSRNISVHQEWVNSFQSFLDHIGPCPTNQHTVDRIDNNKWYEPGNVKWSTRKEQGVNKSTTRMFTVDGITMCMSDHAKRVGISVSGAHKKLKKGLPPEEVFKTKSQVLG